MNIGSGTLDTPALTVVPQAATLRGHVDEVSRGRIRGWAAGAEPGVPVALQILDNGVAIARLVANMHRPDLEAAGFGTGRHGFDVIVPGGLSPSQRHVIQVRREADGSELDGSPMVVDAADGFDAALEAVVARAVAGLADDAGRERVLSFLGAQAEALLRARGDAEGLRVERLEHRRLLRRTGPGLAGEGPPRRALIVDERVPVAGRDAGSQAVLSHARTLAAMGYAVSLVAAEGLPEAVGGPDGVTLCGAPWYASVEEVLRRQSECFDVVYLHRGGIAAQYLNLVRRWQPRARLIYSVADLHHVRLERQAAIEDRPELLDMAKGLRLLECTAAWSADAVVTHSAFEAQVLRQAVPTARVWVVPWALPVRAPPVPFAARHGVAFIGDYAHAPNLDAAHWLLEAVMPLVWAADPAIVVQMVGSNLPEGLLRLAGERVVMAGHVPDLAAVLDGVRLTVAPLRFGAGVKGKVLESLAAGVPCVMSPAAAEGLDLPPALRGLVAPDAAGLAALVLGLHRDRRAHGRAAKAGVAFVRAGFSEAAVQAALRAAIEGRVAGLGG